MASHGAATAGNVGSIYRPPVVAAADNAWHGQAGLICGLLALFMCGILAAAPGLYFSMSALSTAKANGTSKTLAYAGIVLNVLGIVATLAMIAVMGLAFAVQASSDPFAPSPYGY